MPISVERTLISRQTRMIQDLEDERQEKLRKLRLYDGTATEDDRRKEHNNIRVKSGRLPNVEEGSLKMHLLVPELRTI
jgi:hypothetical protein